VAISHGSSHLKVDLGVLGTALSYFPGVPIFFFISGFLVYQSYCRLNGDNITFFLNRILRIYPGVFASFLLALGLLYLSGFLGQKEISGVEFLIWSLTSLTFLQFYNPDFLREFGTGVMNGSLWTVSVEIQFYLLVPIVWKVLQKKSRSSLILWAAIFVSLAVWNSFFNEKQNLALKLFAVSFLPWMGLFLVGVLAAHFRILFERILSISPIYYLLSFIFFMHMSVVFDFGSGNKINFPTYIILCCLILRFAYYCPSLSSWILRDNDISYGIYIYHMPIINLFIYLGYDGSIENFLTAIFIVLVLSLFSWFLIERPALGLKKMSLKKAPS
jgi:peptidoglycan/LPS O-acetylase OafA/YrhL